MTFLLGFVLSLMGGDSILSILPRGCDLTCRDLPCPDPLDPGLCWDLLRDDLESRGCVGDMKNLSLVLCFAFRLSGLDRGESWDLVEASGLLGLDRLEDLLGSSSFTSWSVLRGEGWFKGDLDFRLGDLSWLSTTKLTVCDMG